MRRINLLYPSVILILMTSCVYSLFPIYTDETLIYLPELEGKWKTEEGDMLEFTRYGKIESIDLNVTVTPGPDEYMVENGDTIRDQEYLKEYWSKKASEEFMEVIPKKFKKDGYKLKIMEENDTVVFQVRLAKLGGQVFMDLYPESGLLDQAANNFFPVHTFMKIDIKSDELIITNFNLKELADLFESHKIRLRHEFIEGSVVITAQPAEIQKFLINYSEDERVFEKPESFTRVAS